MYDPSDKIELSLPLKAEYVSVARLAVSAIASRMGFDIDMMEDIKVAVSEVCNKLIQTGSTVAVSFSITFQISGNALKIVFRCDDRLLRCIFSQEDEELGVSIINALMDEVDVCSDGEYILSMAKFVEGNT